ncbi:YbaY family lipoprotein [Dechloromonas sp. ZY10]|uniref:YbaY family lipoprotein n=1 Tax=Dechloromonas aquae TaxID=2664436 RepID=UPI003529233E
MTPLSTAATPRRPALSRALLLAASLTFPLTSLAETWHCGPDRLSIDFGEAADGRPQATLRFADGEVVLPQVPAASGTLYRNEAVRLHVKGDEALFEDGRGNHRNCQRGEIVAASSSFLDVSGQIAHHSRIALPADAQMIVQVIDRQRPKKPLTLAEKHFRLGGAQSPFPFATTVDRDLLGTNPQLVVRARIERRGSILLAGEQALDPARPDTLDLVLQAPGGKSRRQARATP